MIIDRENLLSLNQAITNTADSEFVIDFGSDRDVGAGEPLALFVHVTEDFVGTGTLIVVIESSNDEALTGDVELLRSSTYDVSELTAGSRLLPVNLPRGVKRYLQLRYLVGGSAFTGGAVKAGLVRDVQDKKSFPSGIENLA